MRLLLVVGVGFVTACSSKLTLGETVCDMIETPLSEVAQPPADEAEVMALVPAERDFVVNWSHTLTDTSNDVRVTMTRSSAEATVADHSSGCAPGQFLRVPYDVTVTVGCEDFVATGIYTGLGSAGPMVTVSTGAVSYPSLFEGLGFINSTIQLSAKSSAAVVGI